MKEKFDSGTEGTRGYSDHWPVWLSLEKEGLWG